MYSIVATLMWTVLSSLSLCLRSFIHDRYGQYFIKEEDPEAALFMSQVIRVSTPHPNPLPTELPRVEPTTSS